MNGRRIVSFAAAAVLAHGANIDLSGQWYHTGSANEGYFARVSSDPASFSVNCTSGGCGTWKSATINVTDETAGKCIIMFTGENRNHTGQIEMPSAVSIAWSDGSSWNRPKSLGVTVDVVIVPHSHDDAGWQRTFEGYYEVETVKIINNYVEWLTNTPNARFIQVETSFLQRWWVDANATQRARFTALLQSKRLELVGGGWTMHDEESTSAYSAISNQEYGITWLDREFGTQYRPRTLWQIDPSGHALITPTVAAGMGFDSLVIDRIPDPVRQVFRANKSLQFVWSGTAAAPILATVLDSFYCNPGVGGSTPAEKSASFYSDIQRRADSYLPDAKGHITVLWPWGCDFHFQSMSDFQLMSDVVTYMGANPAEFPNVTARFGTLGEYFDTLHGQNIAFPPQGKRDFHPYVWCFEPQNPSLCYNLPSTSDPAYWRTGMYTSKVALKGNSRVLDMSVHAADGAYVQLQLAAAGVKRNGQHHQQMCGNASAKALRGVATAAAAAACAASDSATTTAAVVPPPQSMLPELCSGRMNAALMTHHDAITGTAYVDCSLGPPYTECNCYLDYMLRMANATMGTEGVIGIAKGALLALPATPAGSLLFGNATAATATGLSPTSTLVIAVGNPTAWARREIARLTLMAPVPPGYVVVVTDARTPGGAPVTSQVVVDSLRGSQTLYFVADLPALGTVAYAVSLKAAAAAESEAAAVLTGGEGAPLTLSNGAISIDFDANGRLSAWTNLTSKTSFALSHEFYIYNEKLPTSGLIGGTVYGFEPLAGDAGAPKLVGPAPNGTGAIIVTPMAAGPLVWEAAQAVTPWLTHTVRLFAPLAASPGAGYAAALPVAETFEFQTRMGPLPFNVNQGGSVVSSFAPGGGCRAPGAVSPGAALTSDTSGFQTLLRPPFNSSQYAQGQVYPTSPGWEWAFSPCDGSGAGAGRGLLSHVMVRPAGTAVQSNSSVWQMLHRRLNNPTDLRGNDTTVIDEVVTVALADGTSGWDTKTPGGYLLARQVTSRLATAPLTLHAATFASLSAYLAVGAPSYSPPWLAASLPPGVLLHSLLSRDGWYPPAPGDDQANATAGGGSQTSGAAIALRLQQLPHAPPVVLDLSAWLGGNFPAVITETTSDFNEAKAAAEARRHVWRAQPEVSGAGGEQGAGAAVSPRALSPLDASPLDAPFPVTFAGEEAVRSFLLTMTA